MAWRSSRGDSNFDYDIRDVRGGEGVADFELLQRDGRHARLRLDLPSSGRPQLWLYILPLDAADWVEQLLTWIDEEVFTCGFDESRARSEREGASYVVVEPYGWRLADAEEYARLTAAAGPHGWHGDVFEN